MFGDIGVQAREDETPRGKGKPEFLDHMISRATGGLKLREAGTLPWEMHLGFCGQFLLHLLNLTATLKKLISLAWDLSSIRSLSLL